VQRDEAALSVDGPAVWLWQRFDDVDVDQADWLFNAVNLGEVAPHEAFMC